MDTSESASMRQEDAPVDGTDQPRAAGDDLGPFNYDPDEIEVATEEQLQRVIEEEGRALEPEIAAADSKGAEPPPDEEGRTRSYVQDHPTHFDWRQDVANLVKRIQGQFPNLTYANTYVWHPPYAPPLITVRHDAVSVDFWGGGVLNGKYVGYRGKPIATSLGQQVWKALWNDPYLPNISWIIWNGNMWVRGVGWKNAPPGPADSDAGHFKHIHVTYMW